MENGEKSAAPEEPEHEDGAGDEIAELSKELDLTREELRKVRETSESNLNKIKYLVADFDNYRKQADRQISSKSEQIKADLLLKFLGIRDDYLRALSVARQSGAGPVVIQGLEGILKNIDSLLSSEGVMEIETVGTPFDPNVHEAIAHLEKSGVPENVVTTEIRKGYMLNGKVLRPSLVEISKKIIRNSVSDTTMETDTSNQGD